MNGLQLALVTRRFWPLVGNAENVVADLAGGLHARGMFPTIVAARLDPRWPVEVVYREMALHRLPYPQRFRWGTMRYMIALSRWLRKNLPDMDLVCVSRLSHEAHAAIGACEGTRVPVVLRAEADESLDLTRSPKTGRLTNRLLRRCQAAAAIIASSRVTQEQLLDAGFERQRVHLIPDGIAPSAIRTAAGKMAARAALAAANEDLRVPLNMPVAVHLGPLQPDCKLDVLVAAWRSVARDWPHARLWLLGDGAERERLYRRIRDGDLFGRVVMPGTFDDIEDVMQACDLLIAPSTSAGESLSVLRAMAAGLPVLASRATDRENLLQNGVTGRVVEEGDPHVLAGKIAEAFAHSQTGEDMAAAAREQAARHHSFEEMVRLHQDLFLHVMKSPQRMVL